MKTLIKTLVIVLILASCEKNTEVIPKDGSLLTIECICDNPDFTYNLVHNNDTLAWKKPQPNGVLNITRTVNIGDTFATSFVTLGKPTPKDVTMYIDGEVWKDKYSLAHHYGINFTVK